MDKHAIPFRTILPVELRVAKWLGLVKRVRIIPLPGQHRYGLLVEGRGFRRMLDAELHYAPSIHRPTTATVSQPRMFFSKEHAHSYARSFGLDARMA